MNLKHLDIQVSRAARVQQLGGKRKKGELNKNKSRLHHLFVLFFLFLLNINRK